MKNPPPLKNFNPCTVGRDFHYNNFKREHCGHNINAILFIPDYSDRTEENNSNFHNFNYGTILVLLKEPEKYRHLGPKMFRTQQRRMGPKMFRPKLFRHQF